MYRGFDRIGGTERHGPGGYTAGPTRTITEKRAIIRAGRLNSPRLFSNRVSFVNSHLLSSVCLTGSRFSPRSEMSAATSGSKHRRCNVHNGLAHNQAAQRPLSQSSCTLAPWATHPVEAGWVLLGCLSQQPVVWTSEMPRPSARYCAGSQPAFWPVPHALCPGRIALRSPAPNPSGWRRA
jgi:hypothetical protein